MTRKKISRMLAAGALLGASSIAFAQTQMQTQMQTPVWTQAPQLPFYFGGGAGTGHLNRSGSDLTGLNNADIDRRDTSWTVRGGWRFYQFAAVEIGYYDFGRYHFNGPTVVGSVPVQGSARADSVSISLVGILPIYNFDLYGRIGYAHSELKFNAHTRLLTANENQRQDEATYGIGGRWTFNPHWALFAEWIKNDRIRIDSYVGGIDYRF